MIGKSRELYIDVVKVVLMFFVINGHLPASNIISPEAELPSWLRSIIVGVSMPCFFAISGMFAVKTLESQDWPMIVSRLATLLWPMFSFGVVFGLWSALRMKQLLMVLMSPFSLWSSLWFLRTLMMIYLVSAVVFGLVRTRLARFLMFAFVYAVLVFLPQNVPCYGWLKDVMHMLPYYVFGIFSLRQMLEQDAWKIVFVCGIFFLIVAFSEGSVRDNGMGFYWVDSYWREMLLTRRGLVCFVGRTLMGIAGTVALLWFFRWFLNKMPMLNALAPIGVTTLGVYTMHQWMLARIGAMGEMFPLSNSWRWIITLVVFLFCHFVVVVVKRFSLTRFVFFGDERLLADGLRRLGRE